MTRRDWLWLVLGLALSMGSAELVRVPKALAQSKAPAAASSAPANMATTDTVQTITGAKTFSAILTPSAGVASAGASTLAGGASGATTLDIGTTNTGQVILNLGTAISGTADILRGTVGGVGVRLAVKGTGALVTGAGTLDAAAQLQADSTTKGFLPPRMTTTQRDAISSPPAGLTIYNTTTGKMNVFTTAWEAVTSI